MSVKDNTGAVIGEIKSLKNGLATIQMGSDTFTVDSNKLGVSDGAASINATQARTQEDAAAQEVADPHLRQKRIDQYVSHGLP